MLKIIFKWCKIACTVMYIMVLNTWERKSRERSHFGMDGVFGK